MPGPVDRRLARESAAARRHLLAAGGLGAVDAALIVAQAVLLAEIVARSAMHGVSVSAVSGELIALGLVLAGRAAVGAGFELSGRVGATRVMADLRGRVIERLLVGVPGRRPAGTRTGDLAAATVTGIDDLATYFAGYLPQLMLASMVPVAVLIWVARIDPVSAGLLAVSIPLLIGFMILIGKGTRAQTVKRQDALGLLSAHFLDVVTGLETLRSYRRTAAQQDTLATVGERYRRETMATLRIAFLSALVLELCAMLGTALVAATVGVQLCAGSLTLQAGLTVLLLAPELYGPLRQVGQQFHAAADGTAAATRIFAALDETPQAGAAGELRADGDRVPDPVTQRAAVPDPATQPIRLRGVSFVYASDRDPALNEVSLTLSPGMTTLVRGPSGSGKSTLARLLLGFERPTAGTMVCGTADLTACDPDRWRSGIAWLPQNPTMFTATVAENVALGAPGASEAELRAALAAAGALSFCEALPRGLETVIGEGGRRLSAGQRQRIALARAILRDCRLLILDEPTAHVDAESGRQIRRALAALSGTRTIVLIAHDRSLDPLADCTVWLQGGRVLTPAEAVGVPIAELAA